MIDAAVVSSFRRAHQRILRAIDQVQLVGRDFTQAQRRLGELEDVLLAHLGRQDQGFYRSIDACCQGQREKLKMSEFLLHDVKEVKIRFLEFLDRHAQGSHPGGTRSFIRDFHDFRDFVINRIKIEEEYLFPLLPKEGPGPEDEQKAGPLLDQENLL